MNAFVRSKLARITAPVLTTGLLLGAAMVERDWPQRADAAPYHQRAAAAVRAIPLQMGPWVGTEKAPQAAAIQVLKPNVIRTIELTDPRASAMRRPDQKVWLSVVQTFRMGDMLGHYPPHCYPALGDTTTRAERRDWTVPVLASGASGAVPDVQPLHIPGMEYQFERVVDGKTYRRIVYNFMVAPGRGILPDDRGLQDAAQNYEQRYHGAAQFQVVFNSLAAQELSRAERDEIFSTLMRHCGRAIEVLKSPG
jgi:hypothetical protein